MRHHLQSFFLLPFYFVISRDKKIRVDRLPHDCYAKGMPKHVGFSSRIHQKGQALLIVVLVMVIALTVGLSVASRSITTLRTS